jgi:hypothetical protein
MKHIKNFRNFSINELQDWSFLPTNVNKDLGEKIVSAFDFGKKIYDELSKDIGNKNSSFLKSNPDAAMLLNEVEMKINNATPEQRSALEKLVSWFKIKNNVDTNLNPTILKEEGLLAESSNFNKPTKADLEKSKSSVMSWFRTIIGTTIVVGGGLVLFVLAVISTIIPFVLLYIFAKGLDALFVASMMGIISPAFGLFMTICLAVVAVISIILIAKKLEI